MDRLSHITKAAARESRSFVSTETPCPVSVFNVSLKARLVNNIALLHLTFRGMAVLKRHQPLNSPIHCPAIPPYSLNSYQS